MRRWAWLVLLVRTAQLAVSRGAAGEEDGMSTAFQGRDPRALEKWVDGTGSCGLGEYITAMPCKFAPGSQACCDGIRAGFFNQCVCRPMPGIVASNGGNVNGFIKNYLRCNFTTDRVTTAPVDYVAAQLPCMDQTSWCADGIPNVDVRMDNLETGLMQIKDANLNWVRVGVRGDAHSVGLTLCKALGYATLVDTFVDSTMPISKMISCDAAAAAAGLIALCDVADTTGKGNLGITCSGGTYANFCVRTNQESAFQTSLGCNHETEGSGETTLGIEVSGHLRRIGEPHAVCGTAGVDERKIAWFDGFQDDADGYVALRDSQGQVVGYEAVELSENINGIDLPNDLERVATSRGRMRAEMARVKEMHRLKELENQGMSKEDLALDHVEHVLAQLPHKL
eukprot:CAMPEP_0185163128 /NCGR_PEP_ID=MMETSP1139-20130426/7569_1 /TAXON_ID=298111 /ORGANISM="Pavlova sp., Strain CCMP459" /LENGTH=395 /DNA_ID=CAMNT_0027728475 /DNA_START=96 /DNA_END=1283 /DNA_ORIENTATION=-